MRVSGAGGTGRVGCRLERQRKAGGRRLQPAAGALRQRCRIRFTGMISPLCASGLPRLPGSKLCTDLRGPPSHAAHLHPQAPTMWNARGRRRAWAPWRRSAAVRISPPSTPCALTACIRPAAPRSTKPMSRCALTSLFFAERRSITWGPTPSRASWRACWQTRARVWCAPAPPLLLLPPSCAMALALALPLVGLHLLLGPTPANPTRPSTHPPTLPPAR